MNIDEAMTFGQVYEMNQTRNAVVIELGNDEVPDCVIIRGCACDRLFGDTESSREFSVHGVQSSTTFREINNEFRKLCQREITTVVKVGINLPTWRFTCQNSATLRKIARLLDAHGD